MKESFKSWLAHDKLEFPVWTDLAKNSSEPPHDPLAIMELSEFYLAEQTKRPDFEETRLREKCLVPFELLD